MKNKKILLFSRDPGGCNSISPLYQYLKQKGYEVLLYAKEFSLERMKTQFLLEPKNISNEIHDINPTKIINWLNKIKPDVIITGTSFGDITERMIWDNAQKIGIPTIVILDHWINYGNRFRDLEGRFVKPNIVIVPDQRGFEIAVKEGIPAETLKTWGNPYYDYLKTYSSEGVSVIRNQYLKKENQKLISFASEPFSKSPASYGYTEHEILHQLAISIKNMLDENASVCLIVRPHPKEDVGRLKMQCQKYEDDNLTLYVSSAEKSIDLILASDLVCGMISQYLIEGAILEKHVLSIQIGLNQPDPFILTRNGIVPIVLSSEQLDMALENFQSGKMIASKFNVTHQCMDRIFEELERFL